MEGDQWVGEEGEWGKGTGNKKHNWQVQNREGEVKNSMGTGGGKELICMLHGHELRGNAHGRGDAGWRGCSIINKIYLKTLKACWKFSKVRDTHQRRH